MKTEVTFAQVAHLYLRSDLSIWWKQVPYNLTGEMLKNITGKDFFQGSIPIFTPFENLIKPTKANKFVAELLEINEGDEYVMAEEFAKLTYSVYWKEWLDVDTIKCKYQPFIREYHEDAREYVSVKYDAAFMGANKAEFEMTIENNFLFNIRYSNKKFTIHNHSEGLTPITNQPLIQTLLIAAGYNVFNIKDCKYEC